MKEVDRYTAAKKGYGAKQSWKALQLAQLLPV